MSDFVYIGTKPCGCTVAVTVDDPAYPKDTAEAVAQFIKQGYAVTRIPRSELSGKMKRCYCEPVAVPLPDSQIGVAA